MIDTDHPLSRYDRVEASGLVSAGEVAYHCEVSEDFLRVSIALETLH